MAALRRFLVLFVSVVLTSSAQGNTWNKVRYNGGVLQTEVKPKEWDNSLTITSDGILLKLKDGQTLEINPANVTSLSYGQEAHRRVGTMVALGILVAPLALFGLFHKTRLHFIGMEYTTADGKKGGLLLQGHKDNYRAILVTLQAVTGAPVALAEKDRKYVPVGVTTTAGQESETQTAGAQAAAANGTILIASSPEGAEIFVDGAFVGTAPSTLKLPAGKHIIRLTLSGYKDWTREMSVLAGSEVKLSPVLEKQ